MKKILRIYNFFRDKFSRSYYDEDWITSDNIKLNKRICVRISEQELELYKDFCEYKKVSLSTFIRIAAHNEVGRFIIENDAEKKYYDSKVS